MRTISILIGTAIAFGFGEKQALPTKPLKSPVPAVETGTFQPHRTFVAGPVFACQQNMAAELIADAPEAVGDGPMPNTVQKALVDDVAGLVQNASKIGVDFPASDVFKLFGWLLKHHPSQTEADQISKINADIDKQVEQYKGKGLDFEAEFAKIKASYPKSRADLAKSVAGQDSYGTKLGAGELLRVPRIFLKATGLAEQLARSENPKHAMTAKEAVEFVSVVFLSDGDVKDIKGYVQTFVDSKLKDGHPNKRRVEHYAQRLISYIDGYVSDRNKAD